MPFLHMYYYLNLMQKMYIYIYIYMYIYIYVYIPIFPVAQMVKNLLAMRETWVQSLGREDPIGKAMATHSSSLA